MKSNEIREKYVEFFKTRGHVHRPSASLIPDDPTVLFTVAGMVQFKPYFLGTVAKPYTRAVTAQKCVRTNDIENVGFTPRHHTFFEMLGNFSFGDYFKAEAIRWAWDFLVEVIGLDKEKLWVTVHRGDDEAHAIWKNEIGVPERKIVRMGDDTNFWTMGETGPCGPCSEILYDTGAKPGKPADAGPDEDEDRYLEVWNLVFTQYDRQADGRLEALPQKNIDTGMGLERITAVSQGVPTNFDTDLFQPLIQAIAKITMARYGKDPKADSSMRVIADHIRSAAFLIADGVLPGNEGRGYVLRRILRRAVRHGKLLGLNETFMYRLVPQVVDMMAGAYPEISERQEHITSVIKAEEDRFQHTLDSGLAILNDMIAEVRAAGKAVIAGAKIFQLYDTYGFPLDLTREIVREHKLGLDEIGFEKAMTEQRQRARQAWTGSGEREVPLVVRNLAGRVPATEFVGYGHLQAETKVLALIQQDQLVKTAEAGKPVTLVLDHSPFYAESGGQVADQGELTAAGVKINVHGVQKTAEGIFLHNGNIQQGSVNIDQALTATVNSSERAATARNHTATHLLHAALRQVLGKHVEQAGSQVRPDGFRFDFSHFQAVSRRELDHIEDIVNAMILLNGQVVTEELSLEEARARGAMALFGEKYGDWVRMVQIQKFSSELCGGTHVSATGEIGMLRLTGESSVAAGIRRIEGVTGESAFREVRRQQILLRDLGEILKSPEEDLPSRVEKLAARIRELERDKEKMQLKQAGASLDDLIKQQEKIGDVVLVRGELKNYSAQALRAAIDALKQKITTGVAVLATTTEDGKVSLVVSVTADIAGSRIHAGDLAREIAKQLDGSGGGRPDFAQAGGKDPAKLPAVLNATRAIIEKMIS